MEQSSDQYVTAKVATDRPVGSDIIEPVQMASAIRPFYQASRTRSLRELERDIGNVLFVENDRSGAVVCLEEHIQSRQQMLHRIIVSRNALPVR